MPKHVYVHGHYRSLRPRRIKVPLWIFAAILLVLIGIEWIRTDPIGFFVILGCVILVVVYIRKIIRVLRQNDTIIEENVSAVRSRYIPEHIRRTVMVRDNYSCQFCGSNLYPEIDHIIPLSRGGTNDPSNLQVLCRGCNAQKGARV